MTYKIKPLEWKQNDYGQWVSDNIFGVYRVNTPFTSHMYVTCDLPWFMPKCDSLAHGKQLAEEHYRQRLLSALETVESPTDICVCGHTRDAHVGDCMECVDERGEVFCACEGFVRVEEKP